MRNIRRATVYDPVVRQLCEYQSPELGRSAFKTYRDLYVFAALLGFQLDRKAEVAVPVNELDSRPFSSDDATMEAMLSLALASAGNKDVLASESEDRVVEIFEQYLAGGLEVIDLWCKERSTDDSGVKAIVQGLMERKLLSGGDTQRDGEVVF